jgi:hypothetical protein
MGTPRGKILINVNDIIGKRLGKLQVIGYFKRTYDITNGGERVRHYYMCKCDCGTFKSLQRGELVNGIVHSCGCSRRKQRRK